MIWYDSTFLSIPREESAISFFHHYLTDDQIFELAQRLALISQGKIACRLIEGNSSHISVWQSKLTCTWHEINRNNSK